MTFPTSSIGLKTSSSRQSHAPLLLGRAPLLPTQCD